MMLANYITRYLRVPFCYGAMDCGMFAFGWLKVRTGKDLIADLPKWKSQREVQRVIASVGGVEKGLDARLTPISPNMAKDGDVAIHKGSAMIFSGQHIVGPGESGLIFIDRVYAEAAWTI